MSCRDNFYTLLLLLLCGCSFSLHSDENDAKSYLFPLEEESIITQKKKINNDTSYTNIDSWGEILSEKSRDPIGVFLKDNHNDIVLENSHELSEIKAITELRGLELLTAKDYVFPNRIEDSRTSYDYKDLSDEPEQELDVYGKRLSEKVNYSLFVLADENDNEEQPLLSLKNFIDYLPIMRHSGVIGIPKSKLISILGKPTFLRRESYTEIWQFIDQGCVLNIYFYDHEHLPLALENRLLSLGESVESLVNKDDNTITAYADSYSRYSHHEECK